MTSLPLFSQIKLVNINPSDIIEGKPSVVLGLIWTIILYFQVSFGVYFEGSYEIELIKTKSVCCYRRDDDIVNCVSVYKLYPGHGRCYQVLKK